MSCKSDKCAILKFSSPGAVDLTGVTLLFDNMSRSFAVFSGDIGLLVDLRGDASLWPSGEGTSSLQAK